MDNLSGEKEVWLAIEEVGGTYEVSSKGNVKRVDSQRILKWGIHYKSNRPWVVLYYQGKKFRRPVHRLVCEAFHGPAPEGKTWVLHWDDNPLNNCAENLRWGDAFDNSEDKRRLGTYETMDSHNRKKTHCPRGHEYSEGNTRYDRGTGHRTCKACRRDDYFRKVSEGLPAKDPRHGTANGYLNFRCRCAPCVEAHLLYSRDRRAKKREKLSL